MLSWWRGIYDHVFIALHPFYGVRRLDGAGREDLFDWGDRPDNFEKTVKRRGDAVRWEEVHKAVAPEVPQEKMYLAIWLGAVLGYAERADISLQERIVEWLEEEKLYLPDEFGMAAVMEPSVGRFFSHLGASKVTIFDEFREHSAKVDVQAFAPDQPDLRMPQYSTGSGVWAVHAPELGILMSWDNECIAPLIAMTVSARQMARPEDFFEGWYADETTYSDVFNPKDFLRRKS